MKSIQTKFWALTIYSLLLTAGIVFMLISLRNRKKDFEEISVKRINIVDDKGKNRVVISNQEKFPYPVINGKEYKERSVAPAGFVFYDNQGNECGGIGLINVPKTEKTMMIFDYSNSEAIGFGKTETADGKYYDAGLTISDRNPLSQIGGDVVSRIDLSNTNKNAALLLYGPDGKTRIKIEVDSLGKPALIFYNEKGKAILSLPKEN